MTAWRDHVPVFEALWNQAMDDTVTITSNAAGAGTYNPVTRSYDGTPSVVYTGPALVRPAAAGATDYGEQQIETTDYVVHLPATVTGLAPDQQLTVDAVGSASPLLVGKTMTLGGVEADTFNARLRAQATLNRGGG